MEQPDYHCCINLHIPVEHVYKGISNRVSEWWTENFRGASENAGDYFTAIFGETFFTIKIAEAIPENKIVWEVTGCYLHWLNNKYEWTGTKILWEFLTSTKSTLVVMTHTGLVRETECFESSKNAWNFFVKESLVKLLTEGKGMLNASVK